MTICSLITALAFSSFSCHSGEKPSRERVRLEASDLPIEIRNALSLREDDVLYYAKYPVGGRRFSVDELGRQRMKDGLPVREDCLVLDWQDESGQPGVSQIIVDYSGSVLRIRALEVMTIPFGNWRIAWTGVAPLPRGTR